MRQGCGQAALQILDNVLNLLDADGQADEVVAHAVFVAVRLRVGGLHHERGTNHQRLDTA